MSPFFAIQEKETFRPFLPYLPLFHGKLEVLMAAWDKGEGTVWGTVLLAFPAVAG